MGYTGTLQFQGLFDYREVADASSAPLVDANSRSVLFNGLDLTTVLTSGGTLDLVGDLVLIDFSAGLPAADNDFDLTVATLARNTGDTVDLTGKKLAAWCFKAPKENAATLVIKPGVANGYNLFGSASDRLTLGPGRSVFSALDSETDPADLDTPAVAAGAKNIRVSGTVADKLQGFLVFLTP